MKTKISTIALLILFFTLSFGEGRGEAETFETATKTTYATATVHLPSGTWLFTDALLGTSSKDKKNGSQSTRIRNNGKLTMNFTVPNGASKITVLHASYGSDAASKWELWYATDSDTNWTKKDTAITTAKALTAASFTLNISGKVRIEIRKTSGGTNRINIDDISISDYEPCNLPPPSIHLTMGNPSHAVSDTAFPDNYLMTRTQYLLSYNRSKATPNWVSWHLSTFWLGTADRTGSFYSDTTLPSGWYRVKSGDYTNSGFDRGHLCPSADRTATDEDNKATFYLTNIVPQAPDNNQGPWKILEDYCRTLAKQGNELYIIAGGYGQGGTGSVSTATTIANGKITVPNRTWKVIIILPEGMDDVCRVTTETRIIAVDMPNEQGIRSISWGNYRVSVDSIESKTGYDFFSTVPDAVESVIEGKVDNGGTN